MSLLDEATDSELLQEDGDPLANEQLLAGRDVSGYVPPNDEAAFQRWYAFHAQRQRLNPNPDDPSQSYDYRAAYAWGAEPDQSGHWPSEFQVASGGAPPPVTREGRPILPDPAGGYETEKSITVGLGGRYYNIPTIYGGKHVDANEAVRRVTAAGMKDPDTGRTLQAFSTQADAEAAAVARSQSLDEDLRRAGLTGPSGGSLLDQTSDASLFGSGAGPGSTAGGGSLLDQTPDATLFGEALVVSGATPGAVPAGQLSPLTRAVESPAGQAVQAGVLQSAPGQLVRAGQRLAGEPVAAVPPLETFWQRAAANLVSLGIDVPTLWTGTGRLARLGIERAVASLAETVGRSAAEQTIFGAIGTAAQRVAAAGATFSAADAAKAALDAAAAPPPAGETGLGTATRVAQAGATGAGRGFVTGAGVGAASLIPNPVLRTLAEFGLFTGLPAGMEGRLPTLEELVNAGVSLGALKLGYYLAGVAFPGATTTAGAEGQRGPRGRPGRTSEDRLSPEAEQFLENAPDAVLQKLRVRFSDRPEFTSRIDEILGRRGTGAAPGGTTVATPGPTETGPVAALPAPPEPPITPAPAVPPVSSPGEGPALPTAATPEAGAPAAEPITPSPAVSPQIEYDGQGWWALRDGQKVAGPFEDPEEAQRALLSPQPSAVPSPEPVAATPAPAPLSTPSPVEEGPPAAPAPPAMGPVAPTPARARGPRGRPEPLDAETVQALEGMKRELTEGAPGGKLFNTPSGDFSGSYPSTYATWLTKVGTSRAAVMGSIDAALGGARTPGALRAIETARALTAESMARYGEAPPAEPGTGLQPEITPEPGQRVQTPEGTGVVSPEPDPFGDVNVDLDDDGTKAFAPGELGPEQDVGGALVRQEPVLEGEIVTPQATRWGGPPVDRDKLASLVAEFTGKLQSRAFVQYASGVLSHLVEGATLPSVPPEIGNDAAASIRIKLAQIVDKATPSAAKPVRDVRSGRPVPAPRYEQTEAGAQQIVPGSDRAQATSGPIRRPESGPAITSADAEANLYNQEATAERQRLEESQTTLPAERVLEGEIVGPESDRAAIERARDELTMGDDSVRFRTSDGQTWTVELKEDQHGWSYLFAGSEGQRAVGSWLGGRDEAINRAFDNMPEPVSPEAVPPAKESSTPTSPAPAAVGGQRAPRGRPKADAEEAARERMRVAAEEMGIRAPRPEPTAAPRGRPMGPMGPLPGIPPPSAPAEGGEGFTRTGNVEFRDLPKESPAGEIATGKDVQGTAGRVVGRAGDDLYVMQVAGSMARVVKIPREWWNRLQAYWTTGGTVQLKGRAIANREWIEVEGPATLLGPPRLENGTHMVPVRTQDGRELLVNVGILRDVPKRPESGPQPAAAVPPPPETPAPTGKAGEKSAEIAPVYPHAARVRALVEGFTQKILDRQIPADAGALKRLAVEILGAGEIRKLSQDPAFIDDVFDAYEGAVATIFRSGWRAGEPLHDQMMRAHSAESLLTGRTRTLELSKRQQFSTPLPLATGAVWALDVQPGETVIEPTAGTGNLLVPLPTSTPIVANEIDPRRVEVLRALGYHPAIGDAMFTPLHGSVVVMNPPWGKYTARKYGPPIPMPYGNPVDVAERFIVKSLRELPDGGRLSAILPTTILKNPSLMTWLREANTFRGVVQSPPGAYDTRGTTVESVLLVVDKGRIPNAPEPVQSTPQTWAEYEAAIARFGPSGDHARTGGAAAPVDLTRSAGRLDTARPGGTWVATPEAGQVESPARDPLSGQPDDGEAVHAGGPREAGVGRPPEGGAAGGGAGHAAPAVVAGDRGEPEAASPGVRDRVEVHLKARPDSGPDGSRSDGRRYSYESESEFRGALDSRIFAPAPLRSAVGHNPHTRLVVKTRSLAGAPLPALEYQPSSAFVRGAYLEKRISDAQWDYGIVPALQANARGHGYLAAADVGVGKTRMGAAVIGEWLETGAAKRLLYVTKSDQNIADVKIEFDGTAPGGKFPFRMFDVRDYRDSSNRRKGQEPDPLPVLDGPAVYIVDKYNLAAYKDALLRLQLDAIVGDEAHEFKNVAGAEVGKAWVAIQKDILLRNGKFLYLTATPATDFDDLRHFIGLREWTLESFGDYKDRISGQAAKQEKIPDLKQRLSELNQQYIARKGGTLEPNDDVAEAWSHVNSRYDTRSEAYRDLLKAFEAQVMDELEKLPAVEGEAQAAVTEKKGRKKGSGDAFGSFITPAETEQVMRELAIRGKYDAVDLWRAGTEFSVVETPLTPDQKAEYAKVTDFMGRLLDAYTRFGKLNKSKGGSGFGIWSPLQNEAKSRMADYRMDRAIELAKEALARGEQPIFSVLRVHEGDPDHGYIPSAIEQINSRLIENDPETKEAIDRGEIPEAIVAKEELRDEWREMRQTRGVDLIRKAFGANNVTVITGDESQLKRRAMQKDFQSGARTVAVISAAGKTGINLHHVAKTALGPGHGRRRMIIVDYEWSATDFKQGPLGRADRSGQITAPRLDMLTAGLGGEKKFVATIANRMRNLGALSKGSAESASNDKLAEFELGGSLDTAAMREGFTTLPADVKAAFLHAGFSRPVKVGNATMRVPADYPEKATLKDFLMDLQFMRVDQANLAFDAFWEARKKIVARQEELQLETGLAQRTHSNKGTVIRTTELRKDLLLHTVEDDRGHKYGVLQGIITPYMTRLVPYLHAVRDRVIRKYVTFETPDEQIAGLEIGLTRLPDLAAAFGTSLAQDLGTPEKVWAALQGGDKIKLYGKNGQTYTIRLRHDGKDIDIGGAKMKDRDSLMGAGAVYRPSGGWWALTQSTLPQFLDRFPAIPPPLNPAQGETPDQASQANLGEAGGVLIDLLLFPVTAAQKVFGRNPRTGRPSTHQAQDPDVEQALTSTREIRDTWVESFKDLGDRLGRTFAWEWDLRGYPLEQDEVRLFQSARRHVGQWVTKDVIGVVHHLRVPRNQKQSLDNFDLFARITLLRDYVSRAAQPSRFPGGLPYGVTLEQVEPELRRLEQTARGNAAVHAALDAHTRLMEAERNDLAARGKLSPDRAIDDYFPHLVLEYQERFKGGTGAARRRMGEPSRPFLRTAEGSAKSVETDYLRAMYTHRYQVRYANAVDDFAMKVIRRHDAMASVPKDVRRALEPGDRIDVHGVEHQVYQYKKGRAVYQGQTAPERVIAEAIAAGEDEIAIAELRQRPMIGQYHKRYLVPVPIAERFERWGIEEARNAFDILRRGTTLWKKGVIGFWGTAGHVVNMAGDLANITRADPRALAQLPQAVMEVIRWGRGHPSKLVKLLDRYDVLQAGYVGRELNMSEFSLELARYPELRDFLSRRQRILADAKRWTADLVFKDIPMWREAVPRIALAKSLMERVQRGERLQKQGRGIDIAGLPLEQAAMKIAREAPVDYGKFTPDENGKLRSLLMPFYSWTVGNATNWLRWLIAAPLSATVLLGVRLLVEWWNNATEDRRRVELGMKPWLRTGFHVNTGFYGSDGKMVTIFFPGDPVTDTLNVLGLDNSFARLGDVLKGDITLGKATRDQLSDLLSGPFDRALGLLTPLKAIGEVAVNKQLFTGREIVPAPLRGTAEGTGRQVRYLTETAVRAAREYRTAQDQSGRTQGYDWLTGRWGLGLPLTYTDPVVGAARRASNLYRDATTEIVDTALRTFRESATYRGLTPRERDAAFEAIAQEVRRRFTRQHPNPVPGRFWREQRLAE